MKRLLPVLAAFGILLSAADDFDAGRYLDHIKFLASPELKGRASGSPELEKAADYISAHYKSLGLPPADGKTYLQAFPITTSAKLGKKNSMAVAISGDRQTLPEGQEYQPLSFSAKGKGSGRVVFAGYGITAPEYNYDDYAGLDVKGKFVIVLRHEPQEFDKKSVFDGDAYTQHAQIPSKASNAKSHGALGVILVDDRGHHPNDSDVLDPFGKIEGPADAGILLVQVRESIVSSWFLATRHDLADIEKQIDEDLKPRSFVMSDITVDQNVDVEREVRTVHNVAAYLPGQTDEYVIIGAHYDHLGLGEQFSMAPSMAGTIHPGADDNASGTAAVLELARHFAGQPKPKRGYLFLNFAGEELGLLGSSYYGAHPLLPLEKAAAMINLDMVGRVQNGRIFVSGAGTGTTLQSILTDTTQKHPLKVDASETGGYGSSDHTSFTVRQVPVLFFFSGLHGDYHKPSDTWDKIEAPGAVEVMRLVADVASRIDSAPEKPRFLRVEPNPHSGNVSGVSSSSGSGYGPDFGSIPDFAEPPKGVRFSDVRAGSPAAKAGLKAGDILVNFGGKDIQNLYDFTYALRAHKPGDEVEVEVLRDNKNLKVKVLLTTRK